MLNRIAIPLLVLFMAVAAVGQDSAAGEAPGPPGAPTFVSLEHPSQVAVEGRLVRATVDVGSMRAASELMVGRLDWWITDDRIAVVVELSEASEAPADARHGSLLQVILPDVPPGRYEFSMQVMMVEEEALTVLADIDELQVAVSDIDGPSNDQSDPSVLMSAGDGEWVIVPVDLGPSGGPGIPGQVTISPH